MPFSLVLAPKPVRKHVPIVLGHFDLFPQIVKSGSITSFQFLSYHERLDKICCDLNSRPRVHVVNQYPHLLNFAVHQYADQFLKFALKDGPFGYDMRNSATNPLWYICAMIEPRWLKFLYVDHGDREKI
jgi:hypothetical protein